MLDMGHLITSQYCIVLFFFSRAQCFTFLPLSSPPPMSAIKKKEVTLAFVAGCHFVPVKVFTKCHFNNLGYLQIIHCKFMMVQVFLTPGHPIPNVVINCQYHHHLNATG